MLFFCFKQKTAYVMRISDWCSDVCSSDLFNYLTAAGVQATIAGRVAGNFFSVNLDSTRHLIETVPWVRHAQVRRVWPNYLRIQIEEQQPLALWNENQMINTWSESFTANQGQLADAALLPQSNGPTSPARGAGQG